MHMKPFYWNRHVQPARLPINIFQYVSKLFMPELCMLLGQI